MINFFRDVLLDTHKACVQRRLDQYKILVEAGVDETSEQMVTLQIEIAGSLAHFKKTWT